MSDIWTASNYNTTVMVQYDGSCRVCNITGKGTSRAYADITALPPWMQQDILWLKWSSNGVWSKLGMRRHVSLKDKFASDGDVGDVMQYCLFSPVLKRRLSQLEKENQNEQ